MITNVICTYEARRGRPPKLNFNVTASLKFSFFLIHFQKSRCVVVAHRAFIRAFMRAFIRAFMRAFMRAFTDSFVLSFAHRAFIRAFICACVHSMPFVSATDATI